MPTPFLPSAINRYQIVKLLGSGAMGNVYLADDPILERKVALKVFAMDPKVPPGLRDAYLGRFTTEAKALARLDHPCIVQIYDTGEDLGKPWIAFQFVDGESLETLLSRRGKLSVRRALLFALDIASALQHAHGWNIIHRDIKPANILIDPKTGTAKLTDFGIAQASWSQSFENGSMVGSPGYMSPEQIDGKKVDRRSDIFSLGVVLYQMLSGELPFLRSSLESTIEATCRGDHIPLKNLVPEASKALDAVVRRCLFSNFKMRVGSAVELIYLLGPLVPKENEEAQAGIHASATIGFVFGREMASRFTAVNSLIEAGARGLRIVSHNCMKGFSGYRNLGIIKGATSRISRAFGSGRLTERRPAAVGRDVRSVNGIGQAGRRQTTYSRP